VLLFATDSLLTVILLWCDRRQTKINVRNRRLVIGGRDNAAVGNEVDLVAVATADQAAAAAATAATSVALVTEAMMVLAVERRASVAAGRVLTAAVAADGNANFSDGIATATVAVATVAAVMPVEITIATTGLRRKKNRARTRLLQWILVHPRRLTLTQKPPQHQLICRTLKVQLSVMYDHHQTTWAQLQVHWPKYPCQVQSL